MVHLHLHLFRRGPVFTRSCCSPVSAQNINPSCHCAWPCCSDRGTSGGGVWRRGLSGCGPARGPLHGCKTHKTKPCDIALRVLFGISLVVTLKQHLDTLVRLPMLNFTEYAFCASRYSARLCRGYLTPIRVVKRQDTLFTDVAHIAQAGGTSQGDVLCHLNSYCRTVTGGAVPSFAAIYPTRTGQADFLPVYQQQLKDMIIGQVNMEGPARDQPLQGLKVVVNAGNGMGGFFADTLGEVRREQCSRASFDVDT